MRLGALTPKIAAIATAFALAMLPMAGLTAGAAAADTPARDLILRIIATIDQACKEASESASHASPEAGDDGQTRVYAPLAWDAENAYLVGRQGTTDLWGACGECCIANTLNLATGSAYTEADIVDFVRARGLCDAQTGGMTLDDMAQAYTELLPLNRMDVFGYGGDYAPTIDEMAEKLDSGIILNTGVYGEMMREGGHTGEGEVYGTHWIVLHSVVRDGDGSVAGFGVIDSASSATYLSAQELADVYYGHDGTTVIDPACIEVYGWKRA